MDQRQADDRQKAEGGTAVAERGGSPFDPILARAIREAGRDNRGFALNVVDGMKESGAKEVVFRVEQAPPLPVDEYERPVPWRAHRIEDVESLIGLAKKYSGADRGLILYTDEGATLSLDETKERGKRELVRMLFAFSDELEAWQGLVGGELMQHRRLFDAILKLQHTLLTPAIIDAMRTVKVAWNVNTEVDTRIDGDTFGVFYKSTAGNELVKFPREFEITLPVLDKDVVDDRAWVTVAVRLEIQMPKKPEEPVLFQLMAPKLSMAVRRRIDDEFAKVREALSEWTIVRGTHTESDRSVGRRTQPR